MLDYFNLKYYKEFLLANYVYKRDGDPEIKKQREKILSNRYNDDYLQKILSNTKEFIFWFIEKINNNEAGFILLEIYNEKYINCNNTGGWPSDHLYTFSDFDEEKSISIRLLKKFLGNNFLIYEKEDEYEYYDDTDEELTIGCVYSIPLLCISGNFKELDTVLEELKKEESQQLIRVLKNIRHL